MWPECRPVACVGLLGQSFVQAGCFQLVMGHLNLWGRPGEGGCDYESAVTGHYTWEEGKWRGEIKEKKILTRGDAACNIITDGK